MSSQGSGYDLGCHIYSQDGRVFQIEYAEKAVDNGPLLLGARCSNGVVLVASKPHSQRLLLKRSNPLVHKLSRHAGLAFTGYTQDGRALVPAARTEAGNFLEYYNEDIPPHTLAERVAGFVHAHTLYGGYRPFGLGTLITAFDSYEQKSYLHLVTPSGLTYRFHGCAVGQNRQTAMTELERLNLEGLTVDKMVEELSRVICASREESLREKEFVLEGAWIKDESGEFEILDEALMEQTKAKAQKRADEEQAAIHPE